MSNRAGRWLGILGLMLMPLSCTALPEAGTPGEGGAVAVQDLPGTDVVPLEWGSLVAVTTMPEAAVSTLWFQDDAGTVRRVGFDHRSQKLWPRVQLFRRDGR